MKLLKNIFLIFIFSSQIFGQNKAKQIHIAMPLHPFVAITSNFYIQGEYFNNTTRSTTASIGFQGTSLLSSWFTKVRRFDGPKIDFGQRWYLNNGKDKYTKIFAGVNLRAEYIKFRLADSYSLKIPNDSLNTQGITLAPEVNLGLKFTIFKKLNITTAIGVNYGFNTHKSKMITRNQRYWAYNDWDNGALKWEDNVKTIDNYRKGLSPVGYLNVSYIFRK